MTIYRLMEKALLTNVLVLIWNQTVLITINSATNSILSFINFSGYDVK